MRMFRRFFLLAFFSMVAGSAWSANNEITNDSIFAELVYLRHACGDSLGIIEFELHGNPNYYTYYWEHGATSLYLDNLEAGTYTLVVIDFWGCVQEYEVEIIQVDGCYMTSSYVYSRDGCEVTITIEVFDGATGLPISESFLMIDWEDEDPDVSGLEKTVSSQEQGEYCVEINLTGTDTTCCFLDTCFVVGDGPIPPCEPWIDQKVIINEFNRSNSGGQQFVELLVRGNGVCGDSFDLRGYLLDDNNGYIIPGNSFVNQFTFDLIGVDTGFLTFSYDSTWMAVPNGSLIVIYDENEDDLLPGFPADDPTDSNQDGVYVLPADTSTFLYGRTSSFEPNESTWTFQGAIRPASWELISLSEPADGIQVRDPEGTFSHGQSLGTSSFSAPNTFPLWISPTSSKSSNCRFVLTDPLDKTHFECVAAEDSLQTPGAANSTENAAFISTLSGCGEGQGESENNEEIIESSGKLANNDRLWAHPNPFNDHLYLHLESELEGRASIEVFTPSGQLVYQTQTSCARGENEFLFEAAATFYSGIYIVRCQFPSGQAKAIRIICFE